MTQKEFFEKIMYGDVSTEKMRTHAADEFEKLKQKENDEIKEKTFGCFVEGVVSKIPFQR